MTTKLGRSVLRNVIVEERKSRPFPIVVFVLLPDHLHVVWTLPPGDADFSSRWSRIKSNFTRLYVKAGGEDEIKSISRQRHDERVIWQRRFWEHASRGHHDLKRCIDYLHGNPVKHGISSTVAEYPWSSFHRFVRDGEYEPGWGGENEFLGVIGAGWE